MGYRFGGRETTDGQHSLDINWLNRKGSLMPGSSSSIRWTRRGQDSGSIALRAESGRLDAGVSLAVARRRMGGRRGGCPIDLGIPATTAGNVLGLCVLVRTAGEESACCMGTGK